jgi:hypothetical protein
MRLTDFLRTPVRVDHQARMLDLTVSEQPLVVAALAPGDPLPQSLVLGFRVDAAQSEVQIAPCWEGDLWFIADSTSGYPQAPADATQVKAAQWDLTGDLVLESLKESRALEKALTSPELIVSPTPNIVRYSKVKLTIAFLFTTLPTAKKREFIVAGKTIRVADPNFHAHQVIQFLAGKMSVPCAVDATDPTRDFASKDMPLIKVATGNARTVFRVSMSHRSTIANEWLDRRPEDLFAPAPLLDPALSTVEHNLLNPAHPAHSPIPPLALFRTVREAAVLTTHRAGPLWPLLRATAADGTHYVRVQVLRPPIPGDAVTLFPTRPFPQLALSVAPAANLLQRSVVRLPINGSVYLPLEADSYSFWGSRYGDIVNSFVDEELISVSLRDPAKHFIDNGKLMVTKPIAANETSFHLFAHLLKYDSDRTFQAWVDLKWKYKKFMNDAADAWNLTVGVGVNADRSSVKRWSIYVHDREADSLAIRDWGRIHGLIRSAAGRHGLAPEFLHAVMFGEGVGGPGARIMINWELPPPTPYTDRPPNPLFGFSELGLDRIWCDLVAPGVGLQDGGYINTARFGAGTSEITEVPNPAGDTNEDGVTVICSGDASSWTSAVEYTAATLNARLDNMVGRTTKTREQIPEAQRRWLAYFRFHSYNATNIQKAVTERALHVKDRWDHTPPPAAGVFGFDTVRFKTIQRMAVADWYEKAKVYR